MTEFAGQTFQELCAEADTRLQNNDRELAQDIILRAEAAHNELDIPSFSAGDWLVRCVGSRLLAEEFRQDTVHLERETVRRIRNYAPMVAKAYYAALRAEHAAGEENAAFYAVSASVQLASVEARHPFRDAVMDAFAHPEPGGLSDWKYEPLESEELPENILKQHGRYKQIKVLGSPGNTSLEVEEWGRNQLVTPNKLGLDVAMSGQAVLALPEEQFVRVESDSIWQSPKQPMKLPVTLDRDVPSVRAKLEVWDGQQPEVLEFGQLAVPGSEAATAESDYGRYIHNPTVSPEDALRLLGDAIPWTDSTQRFLKGLEGQLRAACHIDPDAQYRAAFQEARLAIAEQLASQNVQATALGYLAVGKRIGDMVKSFPKENWHHVTDSFFKP